MTRISRLTIIGAAVLAGALSVWYLWPSEERAIRNRLDALAAAVNENAAEGLGAVARAAAIGGFVTQDVAIDLGHGGGPIHGRDTLIGIAARLPAGPAGYALEFDDVAVAVSRETETADVSAVALVTRASGSAGERSTEARELKLSMTKQDGTWRIARVTAVDTLRRE